MLNLVFHAKDDLQRELLGELYKPDTIGRLSSCPNRRVSLTPLSVSQTRFSRRATRSYSVARRLARWYRL
jgi:hypothetical protein